MGHATKHVCASLSPENAISETIVRAACLSAAQFNLQTLKQRRDMKLFYKEQRQIEKGENIHELKSNFLHCPYTPGQAFVSMMNNQPHRSQVPAVARKGVSELF